MQRKTLNIFNTKIVLSLILAIFSFMTGCGSKSGSTPSEQPAIPVTTVYPVIKDITSYIEAIGVLLPSIQMEIRPQVSGPVTQVMVKEGEWVDVNTPLFLIDTKIYEIKLNEALAQKASDLATLIASQKKLERFQELKDKDLVAQTEWDDLIAQTARAKASVDMDEAREAAANYDLEHCKIISPIKGRLGKIDVRAGLLVTAGQITPLCTISELDPLIIEFNVNEKEFPKIKDGTTDIKIETLCSKESCKEAKITFFDNHFDRKTGQLLIRGEVSNPQYTLRPGQSLRIKIPVDTLKEAILIPHKAVRFNQEGPYVFVLDEDLKVKQNSITLGHEDGDLIIVKEGLSKTDQIILDGHMRVSTGSKVDIKS